MTASEMGQKGGPARAAALSARRRKQIAKMGGIARAKNAKKKGASK